MDLALEPMVPGPPEAMCPLPAPSAVALQAKLAWSLALEGHAQADGD
jgi:hypothetical protein